MSKHLLYPCALAALSALPLAGDGKEPAVSEKALSEAGTPATFSWVDIEGDGRLELAAVSAEGAFQLLAAAGEDRFEDVSERVGLAGVTDAALALWVDYDADGRLDLFVGARAGASRLFRNEGGSFVDMTAGAGLATEGAVRSADWVDHDGDGRADLHVVTTERHELYRGLDGGFFERVALSLAGARGVAGPSGVVPTGDSPETPSAAGSSSDEPGSRGSVPGAVDGARSTRYRALPGEPRSAGGTTALTVLPVGCAPSIKDQANPSTCLQASTTPTLGRLFPISTNLFVAVSGDVGIGTTSPGAKLEVAGTARITDTLTLAPSGDMALDVSSGSIYKGGTPFIHTKGGSNNAAFGPGALSSVTIGVSNTASGASALASNTVGTYNTANGHDTLLANTSGFANTATGASALSTNTTGIYNTAMGRSALRVNTTGNSNTAVGVSALQSNTTGIFNAATGRNALLFNTVGDNNTASGVAALQANTSGSSNTATGRSALASNTTGNANTATGQSALALNTTASGNTAVGYRALRNNTTSSDNTASGYRALEANTGSNNTAIGSRALQYNTTGNHNAAVGDRALLSNTTGSDNTASGYRALESNTTGFLNTASGSRSLQYNTTGTANTASGVDALRYNTTGGANTASGYEALHSNTTGTLNTASGHGALRSNTVGHSNTASGYRALAGNTTGLRNIAVGRDSGQNLTTGNDNIDIGNGGVAGESATIRIGNSQTRAFIVGIRGVCTGVADAVAVFVDSAGQLGTCNSSRRFKKDIDDMGDRTERLLDLRPVVFHYKQEQTLPDGSEVPLEYGLIAEEVAEIFPELVVYDEEGQALTVKYHLLSAMLLNEVQRLSERDTAQTRELERLRRLEVRLDELESRFAAGDR